MSREKRLGRGLEALLGRSLEAQPQQSQPQPQQIATSQHTTSLPEDADFATRIAALHTSQLPAGISRDARGQVWLQVKAIVPNPYQPRKHFDASEIKELTESIQTHGILQPLVVRETEGRYELVAGERRMRAATLAEWDSVPVQFRAITDREMAELAIVENVQRKDLNPLEKAASFQKYMKQYKCTQEELASRVHVDRSTIANLVRLLELPEAVKQILMQGDISQGHARALLPLGNEVEQIKFANQIKQDSISVRATEKMVREHLQPPEAVLLSIEAHRSEALAAKTDSLSKASAQTRSQQIISLEQQLKVTIGSKVLLKQNNEGGGSITISFKDNEEFGRIFTQLVGPSKDFRKKTA